MINSVILISLAIGWWYILSERNKLVREKHKQKRHIEAAIQRETKTFTPPEYFIWDISNESFNGEQNEL